MTDANASGPEFDAWAEYYDIVHTGIAGDVEFYVGQAVRAQSPVLEIGCGTGRIAVPMAMSGVEVTGLDSSPAMLDICADKYEAVRPAEGSLELFRGDMADFDLGRRFALVLMPYRTFMHLLDRDSQVAALQCVANHLEPGGRFVMDTWRPQLSKLVEHGAPVDATPLCFAGRYAIPGEDVVLAHYQAARVDKERQLLDEEHLLHEVAPSGEVLRVASLSMRRLWSTVSELRALFTAAGFGLEALFGDFDCGPLSAGSDEMIWVLRRR